MSITNETIKFNNKDMNIKFTLKADVDFIDYQQEIDNLTQFTGIDLINPVVDAEVYRFVYSPSVELTFDFTNTGSVDNGFIDAGFTQNEIDTRDISILNSFFILDFYDTFDVNTQSKIFTTYLTKLGTSPTYTLSNTTINQLYGLYVPSSYFVGKTTPIVSGYAKFSFYNAKSGNGGIALFQNQDIVGTTPEKMFFKIELDSINRTWKFITTTPNKLKAKQLPSNSAYSDKINDTYDKFENKKQLYPNGNMFNVADGSYLNI